MCGIFGFVSRRPTAVAHFHALAEHNTVRGNLGFGGSYLADGALHTFRETTPYDAAAVPFAETTLALGHIRADIAEGATLALKGGDIDSTAAVVAMSIYDPRKSRTHV